MYQLDTRIRINPLSGVGPIEDEVGANAVGCEVVIGAGARVKGGVDGAIIAIGAVEGGRTGSVITGATGAASPISSSKLVSHPVNEE